jgi:hypothetical protein
MGKTSFKLNDMEYFNTQKEANPITFQQEPVKSTTQ